MQGYQHFTCCTLLHRMSYLTVFWKTIISLQPLTHQGLCTRLHGFIFHKQAVILRCVHTYTVEPNSVRSVSQRRVSDSVAYFQWPPRQCVHTRRVESSRVESCRVESHESCRVKILDGACSIFVCQTPVIGRDGYYLGEEMDEEKLILLVKDYEAILDALRCERRYRDYIASDWQKIAQEVGVG